jgi:ABC-type glutathione transport system ATPase component
MVEHDMGLVSRVSDRVLAMNQGEVLAMGTPAEVQAHPGVIEAYLGGVEMRLSAAPILDSSTTSRRLRPGQGHPRRER